MRSIVIIVVALATACGGTSISQHPDAGIIKDAGTSDAGPRFAFDGLVCMWRNFDAPTGKWHYELEAPITSKDSMPADYAITATGHTWPDAAVQSERDFSWGPFTMAGPTEHRDITWSVVAEPKDATELYGFDLTLIDQTDGAAEEADHRHVDLLLYYANQNTEISDWSRSADCNPRYP